MNTHIPSYKQALNYYLRDDIAHLMWELSRRRPLKFFHYSAVDLSQGDADAHRTPYGIKLHCLPSATELKRKIQEAVGEREEHAPGFVPFFNMSNTANEPDKPDNIIGWDMRFEFDFDQVQSFRAVIPIVALLDHFGVPFLAKYSGHRSLHLTIPAEAFPARLRQPVIHQTWMAAFQTLGNLFCHFSPAMDHGSTRISKEMVLTAPYSFHRYYGRLSLPLNLNEAMNFDPTIAALPAFSGVHWHPDQFIDDGDHMASLLDLAQNRISRSDEIVALARTVFAGNQWQYFGADRQTTTQVADPIAATLMAGLPQINFSPNVGELTAVQHTRLQQARIIIDSPEAKEIKFYRLIGQVGFGVPEETVTAVRVTLAAALSHWVQGGLAGTIDHLLGLAASESVAVPVACAVRILSFLPDEVGQKVEALAARWQQLAGVPSPEAALVALALGELSVEQAHALDAFDVVDETAVHLPQIISQTKWRTEQQPETAVATLHLAFGMETIDAWLKASDEAFLIRSIFGESGSGNKLKFAAAKLFRQLEPLTV